MTGTSGSSAASNLNASQEKLKRNSSNVGWEYGELIDPNDLDKIKCKLCGHKCSGGVYRIKQHVAGIKGNVKACSVANEDDRKKCKAALDEGKNKKREKQKQQTEVRDEVQLTLDEDIEEDEDLASIGSKRPRKLGPMDRYRSTIDPETSLETRRKTGQQNIHDALWKQRTEEVHQFLARWVYEAGIPFHSISHDSFERFVEAVGQFGPGYKPPTQYQLREPLLKKEVEKTKQSLKVQEEEWEKTGCSIMTDAWTDRKRRSIMNLCVNSRVGTSFLSSKEDSAESHTAEHIFEYVDKCIEEVGPEKVVQVVTDNASNNMAAANLLMTKRPNMFWTSCATHTLNLMLEGIGTQIFIIVYFSKLLGSNEISITITQY